MPHAIEEIARNLHQARRRRGLSQRALSKRAGVPQGQISRIENGAVDLRLSSLVELARALDLELTLVPRPAVPAVSAIIRSSTVGPAAGASAKAAPGSLGEEAVRPAYTLDAPGDG